MAGTLIVSNLKTDTDNTFIVRSNTGATLFSANTSGIDIANSIGAIAITNDKILSVANTKISGNIISSQIASVSGSVITANTIANSAFQTGSVENYMNSQNLGFGMRNRIINGQMQIAQRANSATITAAATIAAGYSTVDRFYVYCTGANVTAAQVAGSGATKNRLQITGAASVTAVGIGQRIEANNSYDLANSICTLSADLAISANLTTVTWTASCANTADTFGASSSNTNTQISTGTFTVGPTVTNFSTNISIPAAATTGIQILFTVGALTAGLTWTIGNVQFEKGSTATSFDYRPYGTELMLCQRYYEIIGGGGQSIYVRAYSAASAPLTQYIPFQVAKRIVPSPLTKVGTWAVANSAQPTVSTGSTQGFNIQGVATALADTYYLASTSSEYVTASSEL